MKKAKYPCYSNEVSLSSDVKVSAELDILAVILASNLLVYSN